MATAVPVDDVVHAGGGPYRHDELDLLVVGIASGAAGLAWFVRLSLLGLVGFLAVIVLLIG